MRSATRIRAIDRSNADSARAISSSVVAALRSVIRSCALRPRRLGPIHVDVFGVFRRIRPVLSLDPGQLGKAAANHQRRLFA